MWLTQAGGSWDTDAHSFTDKSMTAILQEIRL